MTEQRPPYPCEYVDPQPVGVDVAGNDTPLVLVRQRLAHDRLRKERDAEERSRGEKFTIGQTFQEHVDRWLANNHKNADDVMWARFPLGMVGNWIERAAAAEARLGETQARFAREALAGPDTPADNKADTA